MAKQGLVSFTAHLDELIWTSILGWPRFWCALYFAIFRVLNENLDWFLVWACRYTCDLNRVDRGEQCPLPDNATSVYFKTGETADETIRAVVNRGWRLRHPWILKNDDCVVTLMLGKYEAVSIRDDGVVNHNIWETRREFRDAARQRMEHLPHSGCRPIK
ncbi:uncharacterized protein PgNI_03903 [Pyricularia grisea]|uniref:Uncharacterized protein n=1 Tax=Pyricularia grisea TaxID=148305 RepID=A0A6P8BBT9_PYRGI|nr:uncharacterized protein PgNI_03903 [Pyricularia grisea]TLD13300.1 hypothetical protein PgNI_03903 [Pyricularia grisea]